MFHPWTPTNATFYCAIYSANTKQYVSYFMVPSFMSTSIFILYRIRASSLLRLSSRYPFVFYPICQNVKCLVLSHSTLAHFAQLQSRFGALADENTLFRSICRALLSALCDCSLIGVESFCKALNFAPPVLWPLGQASKSSLPKRFQVR